MIWEIWMKESVLCNVGRIKMSSGLKVDYNILDKSISNLKEISVQMYGDEIKKIILELDGQFSNSKSATTDALKAKMTEYEKVNRALIKIAANAVSVLEMAKIIYENEDISMKNSVTNN